MRRRMSREGKKNKDEELGGDSQKKRGADSKDWSPGECGAYYKQVLEHKLRKRKRMGQEEHTEREEETRGGEQCER